MSGNQHYADAEAPGKYYLNRNLNNDADVIALGQVEATLALAFEQRTANLIALYSMDETNAQGMVDGADMTYENWVDVTKQIAERLGLK